MGDGPRGIEVFPDHFQVSTSGGDALQNQTSSSSDFSTNYSRYVFPKEMRKLILTSDWFHSHSFIFCVLG